jgi:hypothetical protein
MNMKSMKEVSLEALQACTRRGEIDWVGGGS